MTLRKKLSYAEHKEIGARISLAEHLVRGINVDYFTGPAKASKLVDQILFKCSQLKMELLRVLFRDYPERDGNEKVELYTRRIMHDDEAALESLLHGRMKAQCKNDQDNKAEVKGIDAE